MKSSFLSIFILIFLFFACETSEKDKPPSPDNPLGQKTTVVFNNSQGTSTAFVYSSLPRTEENKIAVIPAGQISKEIEWTAGSSVPFFFSYNLNLRGITDFILNYIPETGKDQLYIRIDADKNTVITIPPLLQTVSSQETFLSNNSYVFIQNNSSFSINLIRGINVLPADNLSDTGVNPGERAHYTLKNTDNRNVSLYQIRENAASSSFPASLVNFETGRIYSFIYDNSGINLISTLDIKLANVVAGSLDDPSNKTWVRFINENDLPVSIFTDRPRNNKFTDIAAQSQTSSMRIDPNISGALHYPTYNTVIEDIAIPYEGGVIVTRLDAGRTQEQPNIITIRNLEFLNKTELEKPLTNSAYIKIHNDASSSLSLRFGSSNLVPHGAMSSIVNGRETVLYIVNPGNASNYSFMQNTDNPISFPANVTYFESGKLYSFRFDSVNLVLLTEKPLTLAQAFALSPPESINARTLPNGHIALNWDRVSVETSYRIFRAEGSPDNFTQIGSTPNTTYTDNTVVLGNTYYYKLVSVKTNLTSEMSENYAMITSEYSILPAPSGLTAQGISMDSIRLSWSSVENAVAYTIYMGLSADNINTNAGTTSATSYTVSGLDYNTVYWFTISAAGEYTESYPSASVYAKTYNIYVTVTFNSSGGSSVTSRTVERGKLVTEPPNPTRGGYTFDGWYREADGINRWNFATDTVTNDITLYAKWAAVLIEIEMVSIPAGTFTMGQTGVTTPTSSVTLSAFKMGKYEVTQEQYLTVTGMNPSNFQSNPAVGEIQGKRPVELVTWFDAVEFCNKLSELEGLTSAYTITSRTPSTGYPINSATVTVNWNADGYRLPTEAEWEYACRAGTTTAYNTGETISDNTGWYTNNSGSRTHEVGLKPPNAWGLYDMPGNVCEWCWDWYGAYTSEAKTDPRGAAVDELFNGSKRVRRGGSWKYNGQDLRSAARDSGIVPHSRSYDLGFRLVRP